METFATLDWDARALQAWAVAWSISRMAGRFQPSFWNNAVARVVASVGGEVDPLGTMVSRSSGSPMSVIRGAQTCD
jgi:hypothetical protein